MSTKPWDDVIPLEDRAAFSTGFEMGEARPIAAGIRPAVIVVDMTRAFVDSAYPKGFGETGWPAAAATAELLAAARSVKVPVYYTQAYPAPDYSPRPAERGHWRFPPGAGPDPGLPPGDVIVDALAPAPEDIVLYKGSKSSAFFGTALVAHLIHAGIDTVIVAGMTTSGCVRATVVDAFSYNFRVVIPIHCVADRSQISHKVNLFDMHMKYGDVVELEQAIAYLSNLGG